MGNRRLLLIIIGLVFALAILFFVWDNSGQRKFGGEDNLDPGLVVQVSPSTVQSSPSSSPAIIAAPVASVSGGKTMIEKNPVPRKKYSQPPTMQLVSGKKYRAVVETSVGSFTIDLDSQNTPVTVNNFVFLAREKFYDNTIFHRVIKDFMIQGGDPNGDGTGNPGYKFADEPVTKNYTRGTVAMANSGPDTNGSQFFVMHKDYALPKNYVIFGQVTEGLPIIDKIATAPVHSNPYSGEASQPVNPTSVSSIVIEEY